MNRDLLNRIWQLRNELRHTGQPIDFEALAKRLADLKPAVSDPDLPETLSELLQALGHEAGPFFVPQVILEVVAKLLEGRTVSSSCDPCAGFGAVLAVVQATTNSNESVAITRDPRHIAVGSIFTKGAIWVADDPLTYLRGRAKPFDVIASVLPFGMLRRVPVPKLTTKDGAELEVTNDLAQLLVAAATQKLSADGLGLFVVTPSVFSAERSILPHLDALGIGFEAAFLLPSGTFAPFLSIPTYLVLTRSKPTSRMFVAQLSADASTNVQIVSNYRDAVEGGSLELGRFVDPKTFRGLGALRLADAYQEAEQKFGVSAIRLDALSTAINLTRPGGTGFSPHENSVFIPLIGHSDVVDSESDLSLKAHNYAQVVIDPECSHARYVAKFLNSEIGIQLRAMERTGNIIPKLTKAGLKQLQVVIPPLHVQRNILDIEAAIAREANVVSGLQEEVSALQRDLWFDPKAAESVRTRVTALSNRLKGELREHAEMRLDQWFETLPFPLASILRAWQATTAEDFRTKYEHLLHFFEATSQFLSVILLSAFKSRTAVFEQHRDALGEAMKKQHLSFERATFGTWKVVLEFFGKQTRQLLGGDQDSRGVCADLFADESMTLPAMISGKDLPEVVNAAIRMRNDWTGHGGVVGQAEAQLRNEKLLAEVHRLRQAMKDGWAGIQLISALSSRLRRGLFENEVAVLTGSHTEFLKETRSMSSALDVERLYLSPRGGKRALELVPLVRVGPSPASALNACYFFNRIDREGVRFVSYHFIDKPERVETVEEARETVEFLTRK